MSEKEKIAAIYTTYIPDLSQLQKSIETLGCQVDIVIIVDNSPSPDLESYKSLSRLNVKVICTHGNTGIADALNVGCNYAMGMNAGWAITMDQDSLVPNDIIRCYKEYLDKHSEEKIGAIVPSFALCPDAVKLTGGETEEIDDYMTSGSLISLRAFNKVRGFNEKLFIDMVDTDFGIKLLLNGYKIIRLGNVFMQHNIGNAKEIKLFNKHIAFITHHNYIRRYYITRNLLWLAKEYGKEFPKFNHPYFMIVKSIIRLLIFESDKKLKLKSIVKGIKDFKCERYGKY